MSIENNPFHEEVPPLFAGFPPDALTFLRQLRRKNNRDWFNKNKQRYTGGLKEPMESLLLDLAERMKAFMPGIEIDPKKAPYRIYRDIRFSKDKTPYKTHYGASFTVAGRDRKYDPGYYFHIAPEEIIVAGGAYWLSPAQLKTVRAAIDADAASLHALLGAKPLTKHFPGGLAGETLTRPPRGYSAGDPEIDLLKHKQMYFWTKLDPALALQPDFAETLAAHFHAAAPFTQWLLEKTEGV